MKLSSSTSSHGLTGPLFGAGTVDALLDDAAFVSSMLRAEGALALAGADVGVVPREAAAEIAATCDGLMVDIDALGRASLTGGNPAIPLVGLISDAVSADAQPWVHLGATSQDIVDTALMLMSHSAGAEILGLMGLAGDACVELCSRYRETLMVGRTLGQAAAPTTFGRKCAGWLSGLTSAQVRLDTVCRDRLAVQLGGPVGTLAAFGDDGDAVVAAYAERLGLAAPVLPWHTDRQRVVELAGALGGVASAAAKIAIDVLLLAQSEVAEISLATSGGSSSLPNKQNPVQAVLVMAGAARVPGLVGTLLATAPEHERATGAWHSEWQPWRELLSVVGGLVAHTSEMLDGLRPDPARMRANLDATNGLVMAESIASRLSPAIGRAAAHGVVARCAKEAVASGRGFADVLLADATVGSALDGDTVRAALDPAAWLGSASAMVDRALAEHRQAHPSAPAG